MNKAFVYTKYWSKDMKVGDRVKTKGKPWHPLDSWEVIAINGDRVHLARYEGCGIAATFRSIDTLELIDDYFSNQK